MTIEELRTTLAAALNIPAVLYGARGGLIKADTLVISETGTNAYKGDEVTAERVTEYSVDLYTAGPGESLRDALIAKFDALAVPYRHNTTIFESDTNLTHREYIIEA